MVVVMMGLPAVAASQNPVYEGIKPEIRADVISSDDRVALQAGGGVEIPAGYYARIGIIGAAGSDLVPNSSRELSGRLDVLGRFLFDPFRQSKWGFSAGAGVSLRVHEGDRVRPLLLSVIDLEAPRPPGGIAPAFQLGLGGGIRIGAALRWGGRNTR
jgi:hypothetical protein